MKKNLNKFKKTILGLISAIAFFLIIWMIFFGKTKATEFLNPILKKIPRDESGLSKITDKILGEATKAINNENLKEAAKKGSNFFETSDYARPAKDVREDIKNKIETSLESIKALPAQEIKLIKLRIYEWLKNEIATDSGKR